MTKTMIEHSIEEEGTEAVVAYLDGITAENDRRRVFDLPETAKGPRIAAAMNAKLGRNVYYADALSARYGIYLGDPEAVRLSREAELSFRVG